ncbi:MAG TPA: S9 family peptidase [Vicinamibacterales bacterium]|jgi:dipeptidyl aminopeptidase/acylaminoacyl peptidase
MRPTHGIARPTRAFFTALLIADVLVPATALAQDRSIAAVLDSLDRVRGFHATAISPDGQRVAWVVDQPEGGTAIYWRHLNTGPAAVRLLQPAEPAGQKASAHEAGDLAWSEDGASLAFLSDHETPGQMQVCRVHMRNGAESRASGGADLVCTRTLKGQVSHPVWAKDSRHLAFLYVAGSTQATGALVAYKPDAGVVGENFDEQRIAVMDFEEIARGGAVRQVSPPNLYVYDFDWSPDGKAFAAEAVQGSGTNNYWVAQLYTINADTGAATSLWKPPLQLAWPRWSPDGKSIAVIHGIMSDEGQNGGDIFIVPSAGGAAKNITPNLAGSARSLEWRPDGRLLFQEYVDGHNAFVTVAATGGERKTLWSGPQQLTDLSVAAHLDSAAAVVQSFAAAPEIFAGPIDAMKPITSVNADIKPEWGEGRSLHWTSDKYRVQGWLLYPANYDPSKKYPMVVSVHGGPSAAAFPQWPTRWNAVLPARGYFVLLPNPRGSYGNGEAFTQANVNDFGYGDLRDIEAGVDAAIKAAPIDPSRVGIIGWSYGGYMTMWAITQSTRFHAAVAGAGIVNWQSYYGQNKIDTWMLPFFGASVYDKPEAYSRSSPITFIKKAKTPTLVLHGDRDSEVPTPQGYEFWHALKALNVPTELVIYPDEGHAILKPEHQRDIQERLAAWFDRYLTR